MALGATLGFDPKNVGVHWVEGKLSISKLMKRIVAESEAVGGFVLIVVDSSAIYFEGDDENDSPQATEHSEMMRRLIKSIPGRPCLIMNCNPAKNASDDDLVPRGSSGLFGAVDGNFECPRVPGYATMRRHRYKFRGAEFDPLRFALSETTTEKVRDSDGEMIPVVVAKAVTAQAYDKQQTVRRSEERRVLDYLAKHPGASYAVIAEAFDWKRRDGETLKRTKVQKIVDKLEDDGLVTKTLGKCKVSAKGKKALVSAPPDEGEDEGEDNL
jgi:hypothetical protein